jgi:hypothetical protein
LVNLEKSVIAGKIVSGELGQQKYMKSSTLNPKDNFLRIVKQFFNLKEHPSVFLNYSLKIECWLIHGQLW